MTPRFALKQATAAAHDALDAAMSGFDLGQPDQYRRFLAIQAAAFLPMEQALADAGADQLIPGWTGNRRSDALRADLADLAQPLPPAIDPPAFASDAAVLGGAYVLEGSRLGGTMLARTIAPGMPHRFLGGNGGDFRWPRFIADLDRLLYSEDRIAEAKQAAMQSFASFATAASMTGLA